MTRFPTPPPADDSVVAGFLLAMGVTVLAVEVARRAFNNDRRGGTGLMKISDITDGAARTELRAASKHARAAMRSMERAADRLRALGGGEESARIEVDLREGVDELGQKLARVDAEIARWRPARGGRK